MNIDIAGENIHFLYLAMAVGIWIGQFSLLFIIGHPLIGRIFHIQACRKNRIDWLNCEPQGEYQKLQEKWASGDFKINLNRLT